VLQKNSCLIAERELYVLLAATTPDSGGAARDHGFRASENGAGNCLLEELLRTSFYKKEELQKKI